MDTSDVAMCAYLGRCVRSSTGAVLGRVDDVLADASSRVPQWLVVRVVGPLPRHRALPLALLLEVKQGLIAPISRRALGRAPTIALGTHLTAKQELALRRYWMDQ